MFAIVVRFDDAEFVPDSEVEAVWFVRSPFAIIDRSSGQVLARRIPSTIGARFMPTLFLPEIAARIRRTEVRPMFSWRAISALLTPAR